MLISLLTKLRNGQVEIIANENGNRTTPSEVAFNENERLVGDGAKSQGSYNPENTIFGIKRLIGRRFKDPKTQQDQELVPYKIVKSSNGDAWVPKFNIPCLF